MSLVMERNATCSFHSPHSTNTPPPTPKPSCFHYKIMSNAISGLKNIMFYKLTDDWPANLSI